MHICCANCGLYPIPLLKDRGVDVIGFWYNPNIHPEEEYFKRLGALKSLVSLWHLDMEYITYYGFKEFENAIKGKSNRCETCYRMRLEKTAETASLMGLDGFTTTLLSSPYQKHDLIVDIGRSLQQKYSLEFYYEDFRKGWNQGVKTSLDLGLYRQKYCGCIFSKNEREEHKRKRTNAYAQRI